jgi:acyl-CoA reductase-like NAD-dependent aldehyde dehydrogenase
MKWSEESDVIQRANSTDAGLGASVWTRDDEQARRIASQLQAGNVWINTTQKSNQIRPSQATNRVGWEWSIRWKVLRLIAMSDPSSENHFRVY